MRKKLIAGNWKMNLGPTEGRALIAELRAEIDRDAANLARDREVLVAPPFLTIPAVAQALAGSSILLGAQNAHFENKGAFTGEVAPAMLKAFGVTHVILGHSERRHIFAESDELVGKRVAGAIANRFTAILCVGETLEERDGGRTLEVVLRQMQAGLAGLKAESAERVVVAYEPVWAIGTGRTATPEQAQLVHAAIREALADHFSRPAADTIRILYGGSVTAENVDSLMAKPDIDGALVGGASLKAGSFAQIVRGGSSAAG
ncbi:MAG TPA: triose-phosphate isomerase [Candidatus Binataceae bacterium]|nr:triose-phosphate isomerase [Candidatus Binataceae bacterium]